MSQQQPLYGAPQQPYAAPQQPYGVPDQPYAQAYQAPQPHYQQPAYLVTAPPTNVLAIIAISIVWVVNIGGIVLGHIALSQIKRTGEGGRGLALAALIVGYVSLGLVVVFFVAYFVIIALAIAAAASAGAINS